jgi:hypothetical protein
MKGCPAIGGPKEKYLVNSTTHEAPHNAISPPPVTPYLNTLFSKPLSLCSSLNVSDQVSHPYKTAAKVAVAHIAAFML